MAEEIVIKVTLDTNEVKKGLSTVEKELKQTTDQATKSAGEGGKKIGNALNAGITDALKNLKSSLTSLLGPAGIAGGVATLGAAFLKTVSDATKFGATVNDISQKTALSAR